MRSSPEYDVHHRGRRKGKANRQWLVVSSSGESYIEEVGKHSIMKRTGLPARDLRVLDPLLSYPSTILGREGAIVINLEHIKAIVTATEVLVPNSKDPTVGPFVQDLRVRISSPNGAHHQVNSFFSPFVYFKDSILFIFPNAIFNVTLYTVKILHALFKRSGFYVILGLN